LQRLENLVDSEAGCLLSWRTIQGRTIDFLLTHRRNAKAARRFLAKALRTRQDWPPQLITTDKNPAYGEALRQLKRARSSGCAGRRSGSSR